MIIIRESFGVKFIFTTYFSSSNPYKLMLSYVLTGIMFSRGSRRDPSPPTFEWVRYIYFRSDKVMSDKWCILMEEYERVYR